MCQKWDEDQTSVSYYKSQHRSNPFGHHEAIHGHPAWEQNVGDIGGYKTLSANLCTRWSPLFLNCIYLFYKKCTRKIKISRDMNEYSKKISLTFWILSHPVSFPKDNNISMFFVNALESFYVCICQQMYIYIMISTSVLPMHKGLK